MDRHHIDFFLNIIDTTVHKLKRGMSDQEKQTAACLLVISAINLRQVSTDAAFDHIEDTCVRDSIKELYAFCKIVGCGAPNPEQKSRFIESGRKVYAARKAKLYPNDSTLDDLFRGLSL